MVDISGMADGVNRPMTGIRGAGYPGTAQGTRGVFDPLNQANRAVSSPGVEGRPEETPEEKIKALEKKVNQLIEDSCLSQSRQLIQG